MKCFTCGNALENGVTTLTRTLGGVTYRADVQALVCTDADCNGALVSDEKVAQWEALLVEQAAASPPTSDTFRFMVSWSELSNEDLAAAFGVSTDMVMKYARGQATVPHAISWLLGKIVEDKLAGHKLTLQRLRDRRNRAVDGLIDMVLAPRASVSEPVSGFGRHPVDPRAVREALGLSQAKFAKRYGLPLGSLRNWEQGKRPLPKVAQVLLATIRRDPQLAAAAAQDVAKG